MSLAESANITQRGFESFDPEFLKNQIKQINRVGIVSTCWYPEILDGLRNSAENFLTELGISRDSILEVRVPGAFELPLGVLQMLPCDFVVALGCVVEGDTPHFQYVCEASTQGLMRVQIDHKVPVGLGLLTVRNIEQAVVRKSKGAEAAHAALLMYLQSKKI